mmetsp:Transcript_10631/g.12785  ORF Transcript_10631/g.12785 Transcript_10631/m.12785 type:complete len:145 (+) Transcript_10631:54-488(+)
MVVVKDSAYSTSKSFQNPFHETNKSSMKSFCVRCICYIVGCGMVLIVILSLAELVSQEFDKVEDDLNSTRFELRQEQNKGMALQKQKESLLESIQITKTERDNLQNKLNKAKEHVQDLTSKLDHLKGDLKDGGGRNLMQAAPLN